MGFFRRILLTKSYSRHMDFILVFVKISFSRGRPIKVPEVTCLPKMMIFQWTDSTRLCVQSLVSIPQSPYRLIYNNALTPYFHVVIKQEKGKIKTKKNPTKTQEKTTESVKELVTSCISLYWKSFIYVLALCNKYV